MRSLVGPQHTSASRMAFLILILLLPSPQPLSLPPRAFQAHPASSILTQYVAEDELELLFIAVWFVCLRQGLTA